MKLNKTLNLSHKLSCVVSGGWWGMVFLFCFNQNIIVYVYSMYNIRYFIYFMHKIYTKHCILCIFIHYIGLSILPNSMLKIGIGQNLIYTPQYLIYTDLYLPVCRWSLKSLLAPNFQTNTLGLKTPKKNTPFLMCSSRCGISHYSMCLLSHSSLKSLRPSMRSYSISSGRYTVLPFK